MNVPTWLEHAILLYGYWTILVAVALESMGVPFPGETSLLAGAIYAGAGGRLNITLVIVAAAAGAILGDNLGFAIGHYGGYPLLRRVLGFLRLGDSAMLYAQRYFLKHGDKTVFLGRFFSLLRAYVAFLAGVNRMPWRAFLFWNAFGGIVWAIFYGLLGYFLGANLPLLDSVLHVLGIGGIVTLVLAVVAIVAFYIWRRRQALASVKKGSAHDDQTQERATETADALGNELPEHATERD